MIKIKTNGCTVSGTQVFQDGIELKDVLKIEVSPILPGESIYATITVLCEELDIGAAESDVDSCVEFGVDDRGVIKRAGRLQEGEQDDVGYCGHIRSKNAAMASFGEQS